jgi:hypothetical protein
MAVEQPHGDAGLRENLRNAAPHDAAADDPDSLKW